MRPLDVTRYLSRSHRIGHGFVPLSPSIAGKVARALGVKLPRHGYERNCGVIEGETRWLARCVHNGRLAWWLR